MTEPLSTMQESPRFSLTYAFRNVWGEDHASYLARKLDEIVYAEQLGFDEIRLAEHHFVDDGYVPSPLVAAGAIAARTSTLHISHGLALAPFYHPVRLAEDACYVDNLSAGRYSLALGMGYRQAEFAGYGLRRADRISMSTEAIEVIMRAVTGETFSYHGRHYQLENVRVRPSAYQQPRFPIWVGAHARPGMERGIRAGADGLIGVAADKAMWRELNEQLRPGFHAGFAAPLRVGLVASEDPERDWAKSVDGIRHIVHLYAGWAVADGDMKLVNEPRFGRQETDDDLRRIVRFATPEQIIAEFEPLIDDIADYDSILIDGISFELPPQIAATSLELYATRVLPRLRELIAARRQQAPRT